jgi:hypothetical protein
MTLSAKTSGMSKPLLDLLLIQLLSLLYFISAQDQPSLRGLIDVRIDSPLIDGNFLKVSLTNVLGAFVHGNVEI